MARASIFAIPLALLLGACAGDHAADSSGFARGGSAPVAAHAGSEGTISPGESVEIYVLEDDALSGRYLVRPSGHVILPTVGRVAVAGLTPAAAEAAIRRALAATQIKQPTVMVERGAAAKQTSPDAVTVFMSGSVNNPGRKVVGYVSGHRPTLYQGILEAGGFTRFADRKRVLVSRNIGGGRARPITVDVERVVSGAAADLPLEDGDVVTVKEKAFGF